jgi:hypothetical protein
MSDEYVVKKLTQKNNGCFTPKEAANQGINKYDFYKFAEKTTGESRLRHLCII